MRRNFWTFALIVWLLLAAIVLLIYGHLTMSTPEDAASSSQSKRLRERPQESTSASKGTDELRSDLAATPTPALEAQSESSTASESALILLGRLSLEEKVGQLFLLAYPAEEQLDAALAAQVGGFLFFSHDFAGHSPESLTARHEMLSRALKITPFLAVDEEGGLVNRVSLHPQLRTEPYAAPGELYRQGGLPLIARDAVDKAQFLKRLGLNMNLSPCADLSQSPSDFIYARSLGASAQETADFVQAVVEISREQGMISALKHFPGYGPNRDSHVDVVRDERPWSTLEAEDLLPFKAGIAAGVPVILVSHNVIVDRDPESPASLSPSLHEYLRSVLQFTGVIMTDDLAMSGISAFGSPGELAIRALEAGNDLICSPYALEQIPAVVEAVRSGRLSEAQIDLSVRRLLELKFEYGLEK